MKIGMRKPSLKKSIMGATTSQVKRNFKRSIDPLYGKKGMGVIKNPKKALYNQVYKQTTFGGFSDLHSTNGLFCSFIKFLYRIGILR